MSRFEKRQERVKISMKVAKKLNRQISEIAA